MKIVILLLFLLISTNLIAQEPASKIMRQAKREAKKEDKNIFVKFSASWCYWCQVLDKKIEDESCRKFFDKNYVLVTLTANEAKVKGYDRTGEENPGANELLKEYGCEKYDIPISNFPMPFWLIMDEKGNVLEDAFANSDESIAYPADSSSVERFISLLSRTSNMNLEQEDVIRETFVVKH